MKGILLFVLVLLVSISYCQIDSGKIYNTRQLKKGFYKDYKEFINNSPSITQDFSVTREIKSKTDSTIVSAKYKFIDKLKYTDRLWGFCDGEYVYIHYDKSIIKNIYWKLESFGPYPFFSFAYPKRIIVAGPIITAITTAAAISSPEQYNILVVNENGKIKYPDHALLNKLLSSQPDLKKSFAKEWVRFEKFDYATDEIESEESKEAKINVIKNFLTALNDRLK